MATIGRAEPAFGPFTVGFPVAGEDSP
jgi:hypothetical protein